MRQHAHMKAGARASRSRPESGVWGVSRRVPQVGRGEGEGGWSDLKASGRSTYGYTVGVSYTVVRGKVDLRG